MRQSHSRKRDSVAKDRREQLLRKTSCVLGVVVLVGIFAYLWYLIGNQAELE